MAHNQAIRMERSEWERIKRSANDSPNQGSPARVDERIARSGERVKNWGNTLAASRQQKLKHRVRKAEEAERQRQIIDKDEERIRGNLRKEAIDRATKLVYEQEDQIKRMRSKQIVADSLHVQVAQRQDRIRAMSYEKRREAHFHEKVLEQVQASADREAAEATELARKRADVAQVQAQQLEFITKRHVQQLVEDRQEGKEMVKQSLVAIEKENLKEETRRKQLQANNREMSQANKDLQALKQKERLKWAAEQQAIANYAAQKEKQKAKREAHMRYKHDIKQKSIQKMIDQAVTHLEALKSNEDERVERDVKLADAALAKREQDKIDRRRIEMEACHQSRQQQLQRKTVLRGEEIAADHQMVTKWMEHNDRMSMKDLSKQQHRRKIQTQNAKELLQVNAAIKQRMDKERAAEKHSEKQIFDASDDNAAKFEAYLHDEVARYAAAGKNTKALQSALKAGPELMPAL